MRCVLFHKPFNVLCQFTQEGIERKTLADFIHIPDIYPAGRLDYDSEGLVLLTDNGPLQHQLTDPRHQHPRTYWIQVEGEITQPALHQLAAGVQIRDYRTRPAQAKAIGEPAVEPRNPPVRQRKNIPTSWLELTLTEGRNRQVRRMTAAVGFPTLRLIRARIGDFSLNGLAQGAYRGLAPAEIRSLLR